MANNVVTPLSTPTTNYGWAKPTVGGDADAWGGMINTDLDGIDTVVASMLPKAGGTMSGNLTAPGYTVNGAAGTNRSLFGATAGVKRWELQLGDSVAESGSAVGSHFNLLAYDDTGANPYSIMSVDRSIGSVVTSGTIQAGTGIQCMSGTVSKGQVNYNAGAPDFRVQATLPVGGSALVLDNAGNFVFSPTPGTGQALKPSGGSWGSSSDARVKTVEGDYTLGLNEVLQLAPVVYRYKGNDAPPDGRSVHEAVTEKPYVGLVAQDVETVFPGMVTQGEGYIDGEKVDDMRTLDVSELIFALVNAVKELSVKVAALEGGGTR